MVTTVTLTVYKFLFNQTGWFLEKFEHRLLPTFEYLEFHQETVQNKTEETETLFLYFFLISEVVFKLNQTIPYTIIVEVKIDGHTSRYSILSLGIVQARNQGTLLQKKIKN